MSSVALKTQVPKAMVTTPTRPTTTERLMIIARISINFSLSLYNKHPKSKCRAAQGINRNEKRQSKKEIRLYTHHVRLGDRSRALLSLGLASGNRERSPVAR
jgi:hypothetical protein